MSPEPAPRLEASPGAMLVHVRVACVRFGDKARHCRVVLIRVAAVPGADKFNHCRGGEERFEDDRVVRVSHCLAVELTVGWWNETLGGETKISRISLWIFRPF